MITRTFEGPDTFGDDFANDREIQRQRKEAKEYAQLVDDSIAIIQSRFQLRKSSNKNLKAFGMIRSLGATLDHSLFGSLPQGQKLQLSLISYFSSYPSYRRSIDGTDQYIVGVMETKSNYPRTYIHKESLGEKMVDLVLKRDVDFASNKKFSSGFEVLTEDRKRLHDLLRLADLDPLAKFPDMELELYQTGIAFRSSRKAVSIIQAIETGNLIETLSKTFR